MGVGRIVEVESRSVEEHVARPEEDEKVSWLWVEY
jgi:hypothetical protein